MSDCNNFYVIGSIILFSVILRQKLNIYNIEGMCLCSGAQMSIDKYTSNPDVLQEAISKCQYNTRDFSMVV